MGKNDGSVLGSTKIVDHGPGLFRYTIGLMSEGYTAAEMPQWEADAQAFADYMSTQAPFSDFDLQCAVNIYRVDVVSDESGADDPRCGGAGSGDKAKTYFDASFCDYEKVRRTIGFDEDTAYEVLASRVPFWRTGLIIVNSAIYGGNGNSIAILSKGTTDWLAAAVHELGHVAFGLADEYDSYDEASDDDDNNYHDPVEPYQPNITTNLLLLPGGLKWGALIDSATPIPTTKNPDPDCTTRDERPDPIDPDNNPVADGTIGAFEGAHYCHCAVFRPEFDCRMRTDHRLPFCAICSQTIRDTLLPFAQPPFAQPLGVTLTSASVAFPDTEAGTTVPGAVAFTVESCVPMSFYVADGPRRLDGGPEEIDGVPVLDLPYGRSVISDPLPGGLSLG